MIMGDQQENISCRVPLLPYFYPYHICHLSHPARLQLSQVGKQVRQLYAIALPLIITGLLTYGKSAISMAFLGHLGKDPLAGGSLAIGFANISGYSILSGLAMGTDAISSQAYGAQQWALLGHTLQRTITILLLCCFPISLLWLHVHPILVTLLGQDPTIASIAATYLTYSLPDLLFIAIINPIKIYLRSQKVTYPLILSAAVALFLHLPINYLLVTYLDLGVQGVALGAAIMDLNVLLIMVVYVLKTGTYKKTWEGWSLECIKGWPSIISLAIPNCISVCLEWWWYELMILLSGLLPNAADAVATMGILIQATSLIYIFPSSLSLAVSTIVGNELGADRPSRAKAASIISVGCAILTSILALVFSVTLRNLWGWAFTSDESIIALTAAAMPLLGLCELGNCPQTTMCGVLRGSARPKLGANINLGSFYGVGLPVAVALGFFMHLDLLGLWMGLLAAQTACSLLMMIIIMRTDWSHEAQRAQTLTGAESIQAHDDNDDKTVAYYYDDDDEYTNQISPKEDDLEAPLLCKDDDVDEDNR